MRVLTSSVLIMEAIVLLLAIPVAVVSGGHPGWVGWLFALLALACGLLPGMFSRPYFVPVGWALQAAVIACGLLVPMMFVLGAVFAALWWTALRLGRKAEANQPAG
jgi:hypothetical protein